MPTHLKMARYRGSDFEASTMKYFLAHWGTLVAFITALITILDKVEKIRKLFAQVGRLVDGLRRLLNKMRPWFSSFIKRPGADRSIISPFLFRWEILIIVGIGVLLNFVGLALSIQLSSILYLDMTGTAVAALLLGPWWGGVVGLLSNSLINWLLFAGQQTDIHVFPWSLVNMAGGLFWGFLARSEGFRRYLQSADEAPNKSHLYFLLKFGVLGACFISIFGTAVQAVLHWSALHGNSSPENASLALDGGVARAINGLQEELRRWLIPRLARTVGGSFAHGLAWAIPCWLGKLVSFIPDKTISVAMALAIVRYGLPLFKRELVLGGTTGKPPRDNWLSPVLFAVVYAPSFIVFLIAGQYWSDVFWPLWACPLLIAACGLLVLLFRKGSLHSEVEQARVKRLELYAEVFKLARHGGTKHFSSGLWFGTAVASVLFVLGLRFLIESRWDFYLVAFHFFCVVYGFLFAMEVVFIMAAQNLGFSPAPAVTASRSAAP